MERIKNWYSIIQYMPNSLRGELINIGAFLHDPENGSLKYKILDENNNKIKSLLANDVLNDSYRVNKDYLEYYLKKLPSEDTLFEKSKFSNSFLEELKDKLPEGFILSEPTFSKTGKPESFFNGLLKNYIGEEFLNSNNIMSEVTTKKYVSDFFSQRKLIGTKVKTNAKLKPVKHIKHMQYTIDFVYKNGVINLLQTAPSSKERLNEWFSKINTISNSYDKEAGIYLMYEENNNNNDDNTLTDMLNHLKCNDERISTVKVGSNDLIDLSNKIENEGRYLEEFEKELA